MAAESILEIIAHGAWNGGVLVDNSIYENKGMFFKGKKRFWTILKKKIRIRELKKNQK